MQNSQNTEPSTDAVRRVQENTRKLPGDSTCEICKGQSGTGIGFPITVRVRYVKDKVALE